MGNEHKHDDILTPELRAYYRVCAAHGDRVSRDVINSIPHLEQRDSGRQLPGKGRDKVVTKNPIILASTPKGVKKSSK